MPYLILSLIVQLALVVHILKTGRNMTWVFIVLFFPVIGTLAYLIVEVLPEYSSDPTARRAKRKLSNVVNLNRDLNEASRNLTVADTVQNAMALARECLDKGRYDEARQLYERCLRGVHADDPHLLLGLAQSQFGLGDFAGTIATLDVLKEKNPAARSPEGHLLYAKAQELFGRVVDESRVAGKHYNTLHKEWVALAQREYR